MFILFGFITTNTNLNGLAKRHAKIIWLREGCSSSRSKICYPGLDIHLLPDLGDHVEARKHLERRVTGLKNGCEKVMLHGTIPATTFSAL